MLNRLRTRSFLARSLPPRDLAIDYYWDRFLTLLFPLFMLKAVFAVAILSPCAVFAWRWGEEIWYLRYPVEDSFAAYEAGDHERAHPILRAYAEQGDPRAQTYLATQYERGLGTFRSEWLAARWMQRAADQYYPDALVKMGQYQYWRTGVDFDLLAADGYFKRAAAMGHPYGTTGIGMIELRYIGPDYALPYLRRAADRGSRWADSLLCDRGGRSGQIDANQPPNYREVLDHCIKGARSGYISAMCESLDLLRSEGSPVRNLEKAYELVIIGYKWWPAWEPDECQQMSIIASRIVLGETPYSLGTDALAAHREASGVLIERIQSLAADPTAELGVPEFEPEIEPRLDSDAMVRAETAASDHLVANTHSLDWMMRPPR